MSTPSSYAAPGRGAGPAEAPAPRRRKGPVTLIAVGLVVMVVALVVTVTTIISLTRVTSSLREVASGETTTLTLDGAMLYGVYGHAEPECTATGPSGDQVGLTPSNASVTVNGRPVRLSLMTDQAGSYTLTCTTPTGEPVWVGRLLSVGGIVSGTFTIVAAALAGMVGVGLSVAGVIWLVVTRRRSSRAPQPWAPGGAAGAPRTW